MMHQYRTKVCLLYQTKKETLKLSILALMTLLLLSIAINHNQSSLNESILKEIPHKLWFTYKHDILEEKEPRKFYENVEKIIESYKKAWNVTRIDVEMASNEQCIQYMMQVSSEFKGVSTKLLDYFLDAKGQFKADICRIMILYLHGGYYFDIDLEVVEPYIAPKDISFATVSQPVSNIFFQAFIASTPKHPILYDNIHKLLLVSQNKIELKRYGPKQVQFVGPETLRMSYNDVIIKSKHPQVLKQRTKLLLEAKLDKLIGEEYNKVPSQIAHGPNCNWVVVDDKLHRVHFYSRFIGASKQCYTNTSVFDYGPL